MIYEMGGTAQKSKLNRSELEPSSQIGAFEGSYVSLVRATIKDLSEDMR
jgi:hypothetical protein